MLDIKGKLRDAFDAESEEERLKIAKEIIDGYEGDNKSLSDSIEKYKLENAQLKGVNETLKTNYREVLFGGGDNGKVDEEKKGKETEIKHKTLSELGF